MEKEKKVHVPKTDYYPGLGIISRALYEKIAAGDIRPAISRLNLNTGKLEVYESQKEK